MASGIPVSRTAVQRVTYLETYTDSRKQPFGVYYKSIKERFNKNYTEEAFAYHNITNLNIKMWSKLAEDYEDF